MASDDFNQVAANADMSMAAQRAQYAYGRRIAEVVQDETRLPSEIADAAIGAGMDVVYGEIHTEIQHTFREIQTVIEGTTAGQIKGLILELPANAQDLFDPAALRAMSPEDFAKELIERLNEDVIASAEQLFEQGTITQEQYDYLVQEHTFEGEDLEDIFPGRIRDYSHIYDAALAAVEKDIPVIAADVDTARVVPALLAQADDESLHMDLDTAAAIFNAGLDDTTDAALIERMGIDLEGAGSLIVHRGLTHINGARANGDIDNPHQGFDEILEARGRHVVTLEISPDYSDLPYPAGPDITDFRIGTIDAGDRYLDRGDYFPGEGYEEIPEAPPEMIEEQSLQEGLQNDGGAVAAARFTEFEGDPEILKMVLDAGIEISPELEVRAGADMTGAGVSKGLVMDTGAGPS